MASVNKVILVGNLGKDPEVRYMPSGDAVANITIATSSKYKGKDGNMVEETEWHRVTFFGKLAEIVAQYLKKGRPIYVEGRIKTRKYTDKDGVEKYATDIIANEMQMLSSPQDGANQGPAREGHRQGPESQRGQDNYHQRQSPPQRPAPQPPRSQPPVSQNATQNNNAPSGFDDFSDDIPF